MSQPPLTSNNFAGSLTRIWLISITLMSALSQAVLGAESGVIVLYHHVATDTPPSTSISPADFRSHLEFLRDNNYSVVPLQLMIESLQKQQALPDRAIAITFDDGYSSIYSEAFPLLQSFGFPFSVFLSTEPINNGQRNYMSWDQVREMSEAGVLIGNHMVDHPYMLENQEGDHEQWLASLRTDLLLAEETILAETGQSHRYLAYPYGEYNPAIKQMLAELDFIGLAQNSGAIGPNSDFLALPRYPLASIYANLETARTKFASLAFDVSQITPPSPVTDSRSPKVTLKFGPGNYNRSQLGCFANSQAIPINWEDEESGVLEILPEKNYSGRRWRYICTAPDLDSSRYYWHSVQWIKLD